MYCILRYNDALYFVAQNLRWHTWKICPSIIPHCLMPLLMRLNWSPAPKCRKQWHAWLRRSKRRKKSTFPKHKKPAVRPVFSWTVEIKPPLCKGRWQREALTEGLSDGRHPPCLAYARQPPLHKGAKYGLSHQSEDWFAMAAFGNRKNGLFPTQAAFSVRVIEKRGE